MCTNPDRPWPNWDGSFNYSFKALKGRLKKIHLSVTEDDSIYLSGGEPTLHPHFLEILNLLKTEFPEQRIKLLTNGRRFFYPEFTRQVMAINNNFEVDLSLYGPDAKTHESVTRSAGSFTQTTAGLMNIINLKQTGQMVGIRFVITKLSYKYIEDFLNLIKKKFSNVDRVILIFWEIEAQAIKNFNQVKVNYKSVGSELIRVADLFKSFNELRLYHFPLCVLPPEFWPYAWRTLDEKEVSFLPTCKRCHYQALCLGIPVSYLRNMGSQEFVPITKTIKLNLSKDKYKPIKSLS